MEERAYFIGIDPGQQGGVVLLSTLGVASEDKTGIDPDMLGSDLDELYRRYGLLDVTLEDELASTVDNRPARLDKVRRWRTLYPLKLVTIEQVSVVQRQSNNDKLIADMGWWLGAVEALGIEATLVRPNVWKPKTGVPSAPRRATKTDKKRLATCRAEDCFLFDDFRGARGGCVDWKAESALIAVYGMRLFYGV